mgnify:CR=1 FL=1
MTPKFTHLHLHSHYSLLDGLGKIDDILDRVKELGMDSIALTDHGVMYGIPEFYEKAVKKGIKPIIGCETYVAPNGMKNRRSRIDDRPYHLVLLAKNNQGYKDLIKLVTESHLKGYYYKPRIDLELLKQYAGNLIGMSACIQGEIPQLALSGKYQEAKKRALLYQEILGQGNFFLELQHLPALDKQEKSNAILKKISKETGIPLVATSDCHYVRPEDNFVQDILVCIQTNKKIDDPNRLSMMDYPLYIKSPEEMAENFKDIPEALENTQKIVESCNVAIEFGNTILPHFQVPDGFNPDSYLRHLCEEGIKKRFPTGEFNQKYQERMDYELSIISKMGFSSYFLIVQDFVSWAKQNGIVVGPGRGSAAGSFVSYLTGITNIDPIKYDLLFERFLNPDRISMPDIDMDFADHRRDEVLAYVRKKYGNDHVCQIITFGTMAARAAIRDVGRVLNVEYAYCDKLAKTVPTFTNLKTALETSSELIKEYNSDPNAKKIIDAALRLEGVCRHASVHACGVVITDKPVTEYAPLQYITGKEGRDEGIVTQYSASSKSSYVEKIGLLKMDFLGLRNLTIIENALRIIEKTTGDKIEIENIPLDDELTFKLFQKGETTGIFQLESSGMKRYLKQLKPTVFEDLVAMVALYRPGPMEWIPDFIAGKHGRKKISYLHPNLEPILKNTYGVAVYQEQVMQIARSVAGFTPGEADVLRKAMGKKIFELIQEQKKKFIEGCEKNGISKEMGEKIFSFIEPFAGYGFNRSHAACYALVGYQTAYLKAHYPVQFMAALLNSDKDDLDRIAIEIEEARQMNLEVLPPDINESFKDFAVIKGEGKEKIRFGLVAIKGVGEHIAGEIIAERKKHGPYKDIIDLIERVTDRDMNKKSLEALAMSGALDCLIERNKLLKNIEKILAYSKEFQKNASAGQASLFTLGGTQSSIVQTPKITLEESDPASKNQRLSWEKTLLGLYVSDHPLKGYDAYFSAKATPIGRLDQATVGSVVTVGGIITKLQKIFTKAKKLMYFATIEDGLGKIEILVFPRTLEENPLIWKEENIILVKGKISDKDGDLKLICESALMVDSAEMEKFKSGKNNGTTYFPTQNKNLLTGNYGASIPKRKIILNFGEEKKGEELKKISKIIHDAKPGQCRIYMTISGSDKKLETAQKIEPDEELLAKMRLVLGDKNVIIE